MRVSDLTLTTTKILDFIFIPHRLSPSHSTSLFISRFICIFGQKTRSAHKIDQKRSRARSKHDWVAVTRKIVQSYDLGHDLGYLGSNSLYQR